MSNTSYVHRQTGKLRLAAALREQGWEILGYHPGRSDLYSDYCDPDHWLGLARRGDYVVVADLDWGFDGTQFTRKAYYTLEGAQALGITWQPNHGRNNWHVECQGQVLAAGHGLVKVGSWDYGESDRAAALNAIVEQIQRAVAFHQAQAHPPADPVSTPLQDKADGAGDRITVTRNQEHNGVEITFAAKPSEAVRAALKARGFRWSGRQGLWYARYSEPTWAFAVSLTDSQTPPATTPPTPTLTRPEFIAAWYEAVRAALPVWANATVTVAAVTPADTDLALVILEQYPEGLESSITLIQEPRNPQRVILEVMVAWVGSSPLAFTLESVARWDLTAIPTAVAPYVTPTVQRIVATRQAILDGTLRPAKPSQAPATPLPAAGAAQQLALF